MGQRQLLFISLILALSLGSTAWAGELVAQHEGAADPLAEGWSPFRQDNNFSVGPIIDDVTESGTYDAWQIADEGGNDGAGYSTDVSTRAIDAFSKGFTLSVLLRIIGEPGGGGPVTVSVNFDENRFNLAFAQTDGTPTVTVQSGESYTLEDTTEDYHLYEMVYDPLGATADLFVDGVERISDQSAAQAGFMNGFLVIGSTAGGGAGEAYYSQVKLEIGPPTPRKAARLPSPADGDTDVARAVLLSWTPGVFAPAVNGHHVYFSDSFAHVNEGAAAADRGVTSDPKFDPGRLALAQTYYWRVDEVNAAPDSTVHKGVIWSFTVEPVAYPIPGAGITATASSSSGANAGPEKTIDGSGLNEQDQHSILAVDMWLSAPGPSPWIQYEFAEIHKLHEMWVWNSNQLIEPFVGLGAKDVTIETSVDGTEWVALDGPIQFNQAPGQLSYTHNTVVDFLGVAARFVKITINAGHGMMPQYGLSEVRFFYIPTRARKPEPADGAADVSPATVLSWRAGRDAAEHLVYLDTREQAGQSPVATVSEAGYDPGALQLGETYYWRIDEANQANAVSTWQGGVWRFSTAAYLVLDDFEGYDNDCERIFFAWQDGFGHSGAEDCGVLPSNGNGSNSLVGYGQAPFAETTIIHAGRQSLPLSYDGGSSEAQLALNGQDWTVSGIQALVVYFQGVPDNTPGELYVKINNEKIVYNGDASNMTKPMWTQWTIDLATLGTDLTDVQSLGIGVDNGGTGGLLYVDDIRLYRSAPLVGESVWLEAEAGALGELWLVTDEASATGGQHIGSLEFDGHDHDAIPGPEWLAQYSFEVAGGDYRVLLREQEAPFDSFWVRIPSAASQSSEDLAGGWIEHGVDAPRGWAWNEVGGGVIWTLTPGTNTLEIAKREAGVSLDAIVIEHVPE